jgi:membrane protein
VYGAAGSIFLIMVWIYYSMQIILFGAKLTQVIANRYGSQIVPSRIAARIIHSLEVAEQESASLITGKSLK